jgi:Tfp pilus assembly protein PilF
MLADAERIIQINPNESEGYVIRAQIYQDRREFEKALAEAAKAMKRRLTIPEATACEAASTPRR